VQDLKASANNTARGFLMGKFEAADFYQAVIELVWAGQLVLGAVQFEFGCCPALPYTAMIFHSLASLQGTDLSSEDWDTDLAAP
jgi:hypothetical protein